MAGAEALSLLLLLLAVTAHAAVVKGPDAADSRLAAREMRIGSTTNNNVNNNNDQDTNDNYTVSFVPLFSLLANFLPKLLSRFAIRTSGSKSLGTNNNNNPEIFENNGVFCSPKNVGLWKDIENCHQFYECKVNSNSPTGYQTVLPRNNNTDVDTDKFITKEKELDKQLSSPILLDQYQNDYMTLIKYKCPVEHIYNDTTKQCEKTDNAIC